MDRDADFERFYAAQWPKLVAALAHAIPAGDDPRDAAQEAFVRAYAKWPHVRDHERPDAWLFLTAFRIATRLRKRSARPPEMFPPLSALHVDDLGVALALRDVPDRQRLVLLLRGVYGLSTRETADAMHCPEGTVKSLFARARVTLAASLAEEDVTDG